MAPYQSFPGNRLWTDKSTQINNITPAQPASSRLPREIGRHPHIPRINNHSRHQQHFRNRRTPQTSLQDTQSFQGTQSDTSYPAALMIQPLNLPSDTRSTQDAPSSSSQTAVTSPETMAFVVVSASLIFILVAAVLVDLYRRKHRDPKKTGLRSGKVGLRPGAVQWKLPIFTKSGRRMAEKLEKISWKMETPNRDEALDLERWTRVEYEDRTWGTPPLPTKLEPAYVREARSQVDDGGPPGLAACPITELSLPQTTRQAVAVNSPTSAIFDNSLHANTPTMFDSSLDFTSAPTSIQLPSELSGSIAMSLASMAAAATQPSLVTSTEDLECTLETSVFSIGVSLCSSGDTSLTSASLDFDALGLDDHNVLGEDHQVKLVTRARSIEALSTTEGGYITKSLSPINTSARSSTAIAYLQPSASLRSSIIPTLICDPKQSKRNSLQELALPIPEGVSSFTLSSLINSATGKSTYYTPLLVASLSGTLESAASFSMDDYDFPIPPPCIERLSTFIYPPKSEVQT